MRSGTDWKPLVAWSAEQRARVLARADLAWRGWQQEWVPGGPGAEAPVCEEARSSDAADWRLLGQAREHCAWIRFDVPALTRVLFDDESSRSGVPLIEAVALRARTALRVALARSIGLGAAEDEPAQPPRDCFGSWSGTLIIRFPGELRCDILLNSRCVRDLAGPSRPVGAALIPTAPSPVGDALAGKSITMTVEFAECELSLGALAGLRIGDFITLRHGLGEPLRVIAAGKSICAAYLGRAGNSKAIELARGTGPNAPPSIQPQELT